MCGIYGMIAREGPVDGRPLAAMDAALHHRGPDDSGTLIDGSCAMGMRRLSIIDLSGGHQPQANEDRNVWVVFNGEIYNHNVLRRALRMRHRFATSSDTEVLVHLYEEDGPGFVDWLRGMFGCAIWDRRDQTLVLARDRLGIKPLYYADTPSGLIFASEMKALATHPWLERRVDPESIAYYLTFGVTPGDRSILRGVAKLPPGHRLIWRRGAITVERYWRLDPTAAPTTPPTREAAVPEVRRLLEDAVQSHLLADVEVGAFLSGGIDSATVVGLMTRAGVRPRTFSIGFEETDFDELSYARMVAQRFGTRHEELVVRPDAWRLLDQLVWSLDEPFADVSAIPTWLVSELAARHVKVVLSGDGGDEVFGGYDRYVRALAESRRYDAIGSRFPRARALVGAIAERLPEPAFGKYWLRHAAIDPRLRYVDSESLFAPAQRSRLLSRDIRDHLTGPDPLELRARTLEGSPGDALGRLLHLDTMTYLPDDILTKVDRMSMAHSLEVRPPLLDGPLVEAVAAMPSSWKIDGARRKVLLKEAVADLVPREILERPKRGFGVPIRHWFRGALRDAPRDILCDRTSRARGLLEPRAVEALLDVGSSRVDLQACKLEYSIVSPK